MFLIVLLYDLVGYLSIKKHNSKAKRQPKDP
jgi:hypothetical protein